MTESDGARKLSFDLRPVLLVGLLVVFHLALSAALVVPGHLSLDEGVYNLMARAVARGDGHTVWTGWSELQSPELKLLGKNSPTVEVGGRLVGQYPPFTAWLVQPLYRTFGFDGMFALQALCFPLLVWGAAHLSRITGGGGRERIATTLVLVGGTFSWHYALAAWPHTLAATLATWGAASVLTGVQEGRSELGWGLLGGGLLGLGMGVRLDMVFAIAGSGGLLLVLYPRRWRTMLGLVVGCAPGVLALSAMNAAKFGSFFPLVYGTEHSTPHLQVALPLAGGAAVVFTRLLFEFPVARAAMAGRRTPLLVGAAGLLGLLVMVAVPTLRERVVTALHGAGVLLLDMRWLADRVEPAMQRAPSGAVVYVGGLKKALVQSAPVLGLALLLPTLSVGRTRARLALWAVPAVYIAFYSRNAWHGGLCLSLRYFLPALPFMAAMVAPVLVRLWEHTRSGAVVAATLGAGLATALFSWGPLRLHDWPIEMNPWLMTLPLVLAAVSVLAGATALHIRGRVPSGLAMVAASAALAWGGLVTLGYDLPLERKARAANREVSQITSAVVEPDSLLFVPYADPWFGLIDRGDVRLAIPAQDDFADFQRLAQHHHEAGHGVYAAFPKQLWVSIQENGFLVGFEVQPLQQAGEIVIAQLVPEE